MPQFTARSLEQKQWVKSGRTLSLREELKTELAAEDPNSWRIFPPPGSMYVTGFHARVSAVAQPWHVSSLHLKPFGGLSGWLVGFLPKTAFRYLFPLSWVLTDTGLNLTGVSSSLWAPICDDSDLLRPNPALSSRNRSTYLSNSSEIIWIQCVCSFPFPQGRKTSTLSLHLPTSLTPWLFAVPFPSLESLCHKVLHKVILLDVPWRGWGTLILLSEVPLEKTL